MFRSLDCVDEFAGVEAEKSKRLATLRVISQLISSVVRPVANP
jgi:hypothetical protein